MSRSGAERAGLPRSASRSALRLRRSPRFPLRPRRRRRRWLQLAARLQDADAGRNPILLRVETKAGHGGGKPLTKRIDERTDIWAFVFWQLGMN